MLTNDLEKPGDGSLVYGALLTPKGMIVVDAWVIRQARHLDAGVPPDGRAAGARICSRGSCRPGWPARPTSPASATVAWVLGAHGFQVLAKSGVGAPESAGRVVSVGGELSPVAVALAPEAAPFVALAVGLTPAVEPVVGPADRARARWLGEEGDLHAARVLSGWPALGVEIDERTLPQEVRYDEIGGVSYTKGCYTGQETVARLHFRGHTNRELRGLALDRREPLDGRAVVYGEKDVGSVRTTLTLEDRRPRSGRAAAGGGSGRDRDGGRAAGRRVVALPFGADEVDG